MLPIGPLMIEHRLIERMISLMRMELARARESQAVNVYLIDKAVDFIRTYADRCHHGKEETILFRELAKKELASDHRKMMEELVEEHVWARKTTAELVAARRLYETAKQDALAKITQLMDGLVSFYPRHIEKEDKHFFIPVMEYFSKDEKDAMLHEGYESDRKLLHGKYEELIRELEAQKTADGIG